MIGYAVGIAAAAIFLALLAMRKIGARFYERATS
jgi:hypothetical protein